MDFLRERAALAERNWNDPDLRRAVQTWHDASRKADYQYMFEWLGRPVIQDPQDICAIQEIIWTHQPDVIVETGIARGGSLVLSASILAAIGFGEVLRTGRHRERRVVGVDVEIRPANREALARHPLAPMIDLVEGSSIDADTLAQVTGLVEGRGKVMVFLDSHHTRDHVLRELQLYGPLVSPGSALLVLDTGLEFAPVDSFNVTRPWGPGNSPLTAVDDFLASPAGAGFRQDRTIEKRHLLTCAPQGLLVRA